MQGNKKLFLKFDPHNSFFPTLICFTPTSLEPTKTATNPHYKPMEVIETLTKARTYTWIQAVFNNALEMTNRIKSNDIYSTY